MSKSFWLGIVGGIIGILIAIIVILLGSVVSAFGYGDVAGVVYLCGGVILALSVIGMVAGMYPENWISGVVFIMCGVGMLIMAGLAGVLTCVLFVIAGALILMAHNEQKKTPSQNL